jgi:ppGpp synthetase/RelA/SpoT-type nucleotidyltranferase
MSDDDKPYVRVLPLLKAASAEIARRLGEAHRSLGDPYLVRWSVRPGRLKFLPSLKRKAGEHGWTFDEALGKADDVIGHRIVCNNVQDVERAAAVIEEALKADGIAVTRKDYVRQPRKSGYRAIHLLIRLPVQLGARKMVVGCEVQIQSLLQHAWAELSRADLYKASADEALREEMTDLWELLARADAVADRIRERISRPKRGEPPAAGGEVSPGVLAFLYRQTYKADLNGPARAGTDDAVPAGPRRSALPQRRRVEIPGSVPDASFFRLRPKIE